MAEVRRAGRRAAAAAREPQVIGHRGAADVAPENTVRAFRRGLADGADALELDVHLSADGQDVVIHDPTLDRTAEPGSPLRTGVVADLTRAQLDTVLVGEGEHIPTLAEMLDAAVREDGTRATVLVEIKADRAAPRAARILRERFPELGEADDPAADPPARIISFSAEALRRAREVAPGVPRGYLVPAEQELTPEVLESAASLDVSSLAVRHCAVRPGDFERIRSRGIVPTVWGARSDEELRAALDLGVPAISSDDPARARRVLREHLRLQESP